MFPHSYKKFASVMGVSLVLGLGAMSVLDGGSATGMVVANTESLPFSWIEFFFGLFAGACVAGFAFGVLHHERRRL